MSFAGSILSPAWLWLAHLLYAAALGWAIYKVDWLSLLLNKRFQHVFLGFTVFAMLLWQLRAAITPLVSIHFLLVTTMTLMFRWPLALLAASLALLGATYAGHSSWAMFAVNGLITGVVPVTVSYLIYVLVDRKLPDNFFVFLFGCGFFASALAALASGLSLLGVLWLGSSAYDFARIAHEYFIFLPLLLPPEAVVNGMILTGLLVYAPDWVKTFDQARYIDSK